MDIIISNFYWVSKSSIYTSDIDAVIDSSGMVQVQAISIRQNGWIEVRIAGVTRLVPVAELRSCKCKVSDTFRSHSHEPFKTVKMFKINRPSF